MILFALVSDMTGLGPGSLIELLDKREGQELWRCTVCRNSVKDYKHHGGVLDHEKKDWCSPECFEKSGAAKREYDTETEKREFDQWMATVQRNAAQEVKKKVARKAAKEAKKAAEKELTPDEVARKQECLEIMRGIQENSTQRQVKKSASQSTP